jgi:hypothetical protein
MMKVMYKNVEVERAASVPLGMSIVGERRSPLMLMPLKTPGGKLVELQEGRTEGNLQTRNRWEENSENSEPGNVRIIIWQHVFAKVSASL